MWKRLRVTSGSQEPTLGEGSIALIYSPVSAQAGRIRVGWASVRQTILIM
ncbi:hypothetical protein GCM10010411_76490 [Actinomadura fulvescens]|uniref:Uncharacterized protein n=1 Tax=Actinomadura fulvescens TaxID=46160 RepID=A0ABN3QJB7_9ACTN